jgi:hypothetical protein
MVFIFTKCSINDLSRRGLAFGILFRHGIRLLFFHLDYTIGRGFTPLLPLNLGLVGLARLLKNRFYDQSGFASCRSILLIRHLRLTLSRRQIEYSIIIPDVKKKIARIGLRDSRCDFYRVLSGFTLTMPSIVI